MEYFKVYQLILIRVCFQIHYSREIPYHNV